MRGSMIRGAARGAFLGTVVVASMALSSGEVLAAHTVSSSGVVGAYSFTDTAGTPGARCDYEGAAGSSYYTNMRVKAPTVFWPNQHAGDPDEHGTVGLVVRVQRYKNGSWQVANISTETLKVAHESTSAPFGAKNVPHGSNVAQRYRAIVVLTWYRPNTTVLGTARILIDHYRRTTDGSVHAWCKGVICNVCDAAAAAPGPAPRTAGRPPDQPGW